MKYLLYLVVSISTGGELRFETASAVFDNIRECRQAMEPVMQDIMLNAPNLGDEVIIEELTCYPIKNQRI